VIVLIINKKNYLIRLICAMCRFAAKDPFICHAFLAFPPLVYCLRGLRLIPTDRGKRLPDLVAIVLVLLLLLVPPIKPRNIFGKNSNTTTINIPIVIRTLFFIHVYKVTKKVLIICVLR